jgi:type II secretion system protein H
MVGKTTLTTGRHVRGRAPGFTLLELILVMVIVSTVLAIVAPSLRGFFGVRQTSEGASRLLAFTQLARSLAVTEGRTHRLNLDVDEGTFWLTRQEGGAFVTLSRECGRVFSLAEGTLASWEGSADAASHGYVTFYPDGRREPATIRLTGRGNRVFDITCPSPTEPFRVIDPSEGEGP